MRTKFPVSLSVAPKKREKPWPFVGETIFRKNGKCRCCQADLNSHREMRCRRPVTDLGDSWQCEEYMMYRTHGSRKRLTLCSVCPIHKLPPLGKRMTIDLSEESDSDL